MQSHSRIFLLNIPRVNESLLMQNERDVWLNDDMQFLLAWGDLES